MTELELSTLDTTLIVAYLGFVLFIGVWMSKRTKTGEDLFLAGRSLKWWAIGLSLFASNISSTTLIGLMGSAYTTGISVSNYEWMAAVVLVFFAIYLVPRYIGSRITTMPEFLLRRFDGRSAKYFSALTIFTSVLVDTAGSLYAGAIVLQMFFPGLDLATTCLVMAAIAGLYTAAGGLAAVVYTDVLQAVVLLFGSGLMTYLLFGELGFSWDAVTEAIPPERLSVIRPIDDPNLPWLGTLIGVPILGFYYWCTNQYIVQRVLAAASVKDARWGALLGGSLKLPVLFIMVLPGTMAAVVMPGLDNPDLVFPTIVTQHLPSGVVGLVLAGLVAAIMSSIDSTLNSASTLVTVDFVQQKYTDLSPTQVARVGRIVMLVVMVISAVWAPQIAHFEGLFAYLQQMFAYIVPPVAAVFLIGLYWKRATAPAAFWGLIGTHAASIAFFVGQNTEVLPAIHFTIVAGLLFFLSGAVVVGISLATEPPPPEKANAFAAEAEEEHTGPIWTDYRVLSALVLIATAVLVFTFW